MNKKLIILSLFVLITLASSVSVDNLRGFVNERSKKIQERFSALLSKAKNPEERAALKTQLKQALSSLDNFYNKKRASLLRNKQESEGETSEEPAVLDAEAQRFRDRRRGLIGAIKNADGTIIKETAKAIINNPAAGVAVGVANPVAGAAFAAVGAGLYAKEQLDKAMSRQYRNTLDAEAQRFRDRRRGIIGLIKNADGSKLKNIVTNPATGIVAGVLPGPAGKVISTSVDAANIGIGISDSVRRRTLEAEPQRFRDRRRGLIGAIKNADGTVIKAIFNNPAAGAAAGVANPVAGAAFAAVGAGLYLKDQVDKAKSGFYRRSLEVEEKSVLEQGLDITREVETEILNFPETD